MLVKHLPKAFAFLIVAAAIGQSGPAAAQSKFYSFEPNIDRAGRDYSNTASKSAVDCSFKCQAEGNQCRAWTFVKPGLQGPSGRCFLKTGSPATRRDACCTSGARLGGSTKIDD